jgi:hypothetical protein
MNGSKLTIRVLPLQLGGGPPPDERGTGCEREADDEAKRPVSTIKGAKVVGTNDQPGTGCLATSTSRLCPPLQEGSFSKDD